MAPQRTLAPQTTSMGVEISQAGVPDETSSKPADAGWYGITHGLQQTHNEQDLQLVRNEVTENDVSKGVSVHAQSCLGGGCDCVAEW